MWMDVVFEEALNYALARVADVAWNRLTRECLGPLIDVAMTQFTRNGYIQVE